MQKFRLFNKAESQSWLCLCFVCVSSILGCGPSTGPSADSSPNEQTQTSGLAAASRDRDLKSLLQVATEDSEPTPQQMPVFTNVARSQGVVFSRFNDEVKGRYFLPEVMGGGVAWLDFDLDGLMDLYAVNGSVLWNDEQTAPVHINNLFRNSHAGFREVASLAEADDIHYGHGVAVGDFDADGFADLYLTNYGRNTLLCNNGDGTFRDVTIETQTDCELWSTSSAWLDANQDGMLDLYVVNYLNVTRENHKTCNYRGQVGYCGPGSWEAANDILFVNTGDGHFSRVDQIATNLKEANAKGLAVAVADFDSDCIPEVYVANDMTPNFLLKRLDTSNEDGRPLYREVAVEAGCAVSNEGENEASMGIACSDFDGDGLVDIFLTDYYESKNTVYRNLGSLFFEDASRQTRIAASSFDKLGFGTVAFDANLDGADDIFIANGHVLGPNVEPYRMTQQLLLNDGTGSFSDVSATVGEYFLTACLGRGVATGDFNNDGRPDLAVNHLDLPLALLQNETPATHNFIGLELLPNSRCYPSGGRVVLTTSKGQRIIPIVSGGSYLSSNDPRLLIGLKEEAGPIDLEVHWSPGKVTRYKNLSINRNWTLSETGRAVLKVSQELSAGTP